MKKNIEIYSGKIRRNIHGDWSDVDKGLFIDHGMIESIFNDYIGRNIKITIEIDEDKNERN